MEERIIIPRGSAKNIAKAMQCTTAMVSKSLNFKKNTELAKKIRYVAITQYHGVKIGG